jgi:hypothetical protein
MTSKTLRRGKVEVVEVRERDPDGRIVTHHRAVDAIGRLFRTGVIDGAMHDAAREFQAAFVLARLDALRALPLARIPGNGREPSLTERQALARRRVHRTMEALGGHDSPAGSVVWHVVGGGMSLRAWARRQRWDGRPVRPDQAQGVLVAALSVLAGQSGRSGRS